jgi:glucokinase
LSRAPGTLLFQKKYHNQDFDTFIDILKAFLSEAYISKPPLAACFAVAGPVKDNIVRFTNRYDWVIDGDDIANQLTIQSVKLINDFQANGYGLLTLDIDKDCVTIQKGEPRTSAPIACIGAGTGLGECFLVSSSSGVYTCFPSEGGHAEFAPRNEVSSHRQFCSSQMMMILHDDPAARNRIIDLLET